MPQISNGQALTANEVLSELVKIRRPMMGAQKMRRIVRELVGHIADYDAQRQALLELHGKHDEAGHLVELDKKIVFGDDAASAAFAKDFAELLAVTFEAPEVLTAKNFGPLTPDGNDWLHDQQAPTPEQVIALGALYEDTEEAK